MFPWLSNIYSMFLEISKNQKKHISIKYSHKKSPHINKDALWEILATEGAGTLLQLLSLSNGQLQRKCNLLTIKKTLTFERKYRSNSIVIASLGPSFKYVFKA